MTAPAAILAVAAVLKAFDLSVRGEPIDVVLWVGAAAICALRERWGAAALSALAWWTVIFGVYGNHVVFLAWVGLTFVLFRCERQRQFVVRCQLSILYGFAALSKVNPDWLSGAALESRGFIVPAMHLVTWGTIAVEALLAVALWYRPWRRPILVLALALHTIFFVVPDGTPWRVGIVVFGWLTVALLWWSTAPTEPEVNAVRPSDRAPLATKRDQ